jgi:hypothetical protein
VAKEGVVDTSQSGGEQTGVYSPERLRIKLGPTEVLVNIGGDVAITVSEFNDRLKEFPVGDQAQGLLEARKETLFQMIDYKAVAREGLRRHHPEKALPSNETGNPYASERFLAESVISKSVAIPGLVSDEDAKAFVLQRGEAFEQLVGPLGSPEAKMIHAKILLLDQRWRAQVETWRNLEEIEIFENNLKDRGES